MQGRSSWVRRVDLLDIFSCCEGDSNVCACACQLGMGINMGGIER